MYRSIAFLIFALLCSACCSTVFAQQSNQPRIWKSDNGHETEATLIEVKEQSVRLKLTNGKSIEVKKEKLSKKDQGFLRRLAADKKKAEAIAAKNALAKPVATDEDLDAMGKETELAGKASMRGPFPGGQQIQSNSSTIGGERVANFTIVNTKVNGESIHGFTFFSEKFLKDRRLLIDYYNVNTEQVMRGVGATDVSVEKISTKSPIPDWNMAKGSMTDPKTGAAKMRLYIYYREQVHVFLVAAKDEARVEQLSKVLATFREEGEEKVVQEDSQMQQANYEFRTWHDSTAEFHIDAMLRGQAEGSVTLETRSGKGIKMPIDKLSSADQTYLKEVN